MNIQSMWQGNFSIHLCSAKASIAGLICVHYNVIQLIGYEAANIALLVQQGFAPESTAWGESFAALFFMLGSLSICFFSPEKRPSLLMTGGILLTFGGLLLIIAGYPLTGASVMLASLETARGGMVFFKPRKTRGQLISVKPLYVLLLPYRWLIMRVVKGLGAFGRLINERPFVVGALIKVPMRFEFIIKNLLAGDFIGMFIGLSWMILGDGGLALNDEKLRRRLSPNAAGVA